MMKCKEVEDKLIFLIENKFFAEQFAVRRHIEKCFECQERLRFMRESFDLIDEEKSFKPSPFLTNRIMHAVKQETKHSKKGFATIVYQIGSLAAAVVIGIYLGLSLGNFHYSETVLASNELSDEVYYFDDIQQETLESELLNFEE